jgi:hypothetical protein
VSAPPGHPKRKRRRRFSDDQAPTPAQARALQDRGLTVPSGRLSASRMLDDAGVALHDDRLLRASALSRAHGELRSLTEQAGAPNVTWAESQRYGIDWVRRRILHFRAGLRPRTHSPP